MSNKDFNCPENIFHHYCVPLVMEIPTILLFYFTTLHVELRTRSLFLLPFSSLSSPSVPSLHPLGRRKKMATKKMRRRHPRRKKRREIAPKYVAPCKNAAQKERRLLVGPFQKELALPLGKRNLSSLAYLYLPPPL